MTKQDTQLEKLTNAIEKLIANPVAPVLPVAPVAPVLPLAQTNTGDHDLLTKLDTKVDQIQLDVTELKKQGTVYVTQTDHAEVVRIQRRPRLALAVRDNRISADAFPAPGKPWGVRSGVVLIAVELSHKFPQKALEIAVNG